MKNKKSILLTNAYAVNNGDLALVISLYEELSLRGYRVSIATFYYEFLKKYYPHIPFVRELTDYNLGIEATVVKKVFAAINFFFNKDYNRHDVFIASPGGYVNSFYSLKRCFLGLDLAKKRAKKTAIYSQSIGPLNAKDKERLTRSSQFIDVIMVRDDYSNLCISSIPCRSKIFQTRDAAFMLTPRTAKTDPNNKTVAVSVREWKHENRDMAHYERMIQSFCEIVLNQGYHIEFISTCQGVEHYRDDSEVALKISQQLKEKSPAYAPQLTVNTAYHTYYTLADRLNTRYAFTIGTRLHMCILSLINGTPAFNISYEIKGSECYAYLGLENYSVDFNESIESALEKFKNFVLYHKSIQASLPDKLLTIHTEAKRDLDAFLKEMDL